jgi:hypothetical protein
MISSPISPRPGRSGFLHGWWYCLCLVLWLGCGSAAGDADIPAVPENGQEAWLVTFGPGEIYFESFGHNAIWLREPAVGLDHTFNFGNFAFEQKDFFLRFLRGRMLYFSLAQPAEMDFEIYRQENRSIRIQKLNLGAEGYLRMRDYLLNEILPENSSYRYDYYLNNCSTRIRDALDIGFGGALHERTGQVPAILNFRDQTRRLTETQFWTYLGLEIGLGYPVDRPVTRWDEMFIPMVVADEIAAMSDAAGGQLVETDTMLYTSSLPGPRDVPTPVWYRYLLTGLLVAGFGWLSGRFMPRAWLEGLGLAWVLVSSTLGLGLAALWLFTDHAVARDNANLLLLNPLLLLALLPGLRRPGAVLLLAGNLLAFALLLLPAHQYNLDVLALLTPINLAVAFQLFRSGSARRVEQRRLG